MQWFLNFYPSQNISISDRGFSYGDGLFETISTCSGSIVNLTAHQQRLQRGLLRLGFDLNDDTLSKLWLFLNEQAQLHPNCGLKVIVTRGSGGRGYMPPENPEPQILVGVFDAPDYRQQKASGVALEISATECSSNRSLAGLKHLNRLENVLAKQALSSQYYEAIMKNGAGEVIECIQSNIFWVKNKILCTPAILTGGVQGSMRNQILRHFNGVTSISTLTESILEEADEIFVTNALSGIIPVTQFKNRIIEIGSITQQLMEQFDSL